MRCAEPEVTLGITPNTVSLTNNSEQSGRMWRLLKKLRSHKISRVTRTLWTTCQHQVTPEHVSDFRPLLAYTWCLLIGFFSWRHECAGPRWTATGCPSYGRGRNRVGLRCIGIGCVVCSVSLLRGQKNDCHWKFQKSVCRSLFYSAHRGTMQRRFFFKRAAWACSMRARFVQSPVCLCKSGFKQRGGGIWIHLAFKLSTMYSGWEMVGYKYPPPLCLSYNPAQICLAILNAAGLENLGLLLSEFKVQRVFTSWHWCVVEERWRCHCRTTLRAKRIFGRRRFVSIFRAKIMKIRFVHK